SFLISHNGWYTKVLDNSLSGAGRKFLLGKSLVKAVTLGTSVVVGGA
ncbi:unnamed protein product, partial [Allacma fusca]